MWDLRQMFRGSEGEDKCKVTNGNGLVTETTDYRQSCLRIE